MLVLLNLVHVNGKSIFVSSEKILFMLKKFQVKIVKNNFVQNYYRLVYCYY